MKRRKGYGQFCPVAKAAEVVAERWTPLVLRELFAGSRRFNDLRKGLPLISPTLLSQRLKELEEAGVVERLAAPRRTGSEYQLTTAGQELWPVIETLGTWGHRWATRALGDEDLDPNLLMWEMRRSIDPAKVGGNDRTMVHFELFGVPTNKSRWWLVFSEGDVDLCWKHPGHDVDLTVAADIRTLVEIWSGRRPMSEALRGREVRLDGPRHLVRGFPRWFPQNPFARR